RLLWSMRTRRDGARRVKWLGARLTLRGCYPRKLWTLASTFCVVPQKRGEAGFIDGSGGESQDGLGGFGLRSGERETVHLKKQNPDDKARTLVAVDKWMVLDDACRIGSSHFDDTRRCVCELVARAG